MKVYLGSPIDTSNADDPGVHFEELNLACQAAFAGRPYIAFNPFSAYRISDPDRSCGGGRISAYLNAINAHALRDANLAVFRVDDSPSFGVPVEIYQASEEHGIPAFVFWASKKRPGYAIRDMRNAVICTTVESLVAAISAWLEGQ